jgi:NAD(P)-dependent dehydrogenase (short-subunit alcohol dehydrogenase family)
MSGVLTGRRAFITGSSSGIGAASARLLAAAGASIILHGRNAGKLAATEQEFRAAGFDVASVIGALDDADAARDIAGRALAIGPIDILVNNAGGAVAGGGSAEWFEAKPEDWLISYRANVISAVTVTQAIAPGMIKRKWGRVIQIASAIVDNPISTIPDYKSAKTGLLAFTTSLAVALRGTGVTANVISPGFIATEGLRAWVDGEAPAKGWGATWDEIEHNAAREVFPALVPRLGRPLDIARTVMFQADPAGDFVTGAHFRIDGGLAIA